MSGLEIWLRVTGLVFAAAVITALAPDAGIERSLLVSSTLDQLAAGLKWREDAAHLYALRAYYVFDFLFLLAHGGFFYRLLKNKRPALTMMAVDAAENFAALFLIDAVLRAETGGSLCLLLYGAAFYGKWAAVAWTYFECSRDARGRFLRSRRISLLGATAAALIYPIVFRWLPAQFHAWAGYAVAASLLLVLATTLLGTTQNGLPFRSLFFLRIPLVALAVTAVSGAVAFGPLRAYLFAVLHFYDSRTGPWGFLFAAVVAYFLALLVPFQARIVLVHGVQRFSLPVVGLAKLRRILLFLQNSMLASVTVLLAGAVAVSWGPFAWQHSLLVLGLGVAASMFAFADGIAGVLTAQPLTMPLLFLPGRLGGWWRCRLRVLAATKIPGFVSRLSNWIATRWVFKPVGYFDPAGYLYPAHAGGVGLLLVAGTLFGAMMVWVWGWGKAPPQSLASFSFLGIVVTGVVSGITFFFDRHRVPVILVLVLLRTLIGMPDSMDNVFSAAEKVDVAYPTPGQSLRRFAGREAVLIAASGGGIQAASWMVHVIHELDADKTFRKRVALISAVSGGSVGAYHLADNWPSADWAKVETAVQESSLGPMTSALLGPDLFRPLVAWNSYGRYLDRGFALENSIERHHLRETGGKPEYTMDELAGKPDMPSILFNTTVVETGGPVAFATTELLTQAYLDKVQNPMKVPHPVEGWRSVVEKFGNEETQRNVKASTAARLSATFPYVSPAAKLEGAPAALSYHFVDGGYYDNYGVVALLQWLDEALEELPAAELPSSIRILVIRGTVPARAAATDARADQLTAPVSAFLNMRSYAQWSGAAAAIRLVKEKWKEKASIAAPELIAYPDLHLEAPACSEEPLTWKLTTAQKACISIGWEHWKQKGSKPGV